MLPGMRLGAWLRSGEGIGWLAAGTIPNSLYRVPFLYSSGMCFMLLFLFSFCFFYFVFVCFVFMLSLELRRCSSALFLFSRPRSSSTGLAVTYITGYG